MSRRIAVICGTRDQEKAFTITVDGQQIVLEGEKGICLVVIEKDAKEITMNQLFDISQETAQKLLTTTLTELQYGSIVIMGVKDLRGDEEISTELKSAISMLGSQEINNFKLNESWAMIVQKGVPLSLQEERKIDVVSLYF